MLRPPRDDFRVVTDSSNQHAFFPCSYLPFGRDGAIEQFINARLIYERLAEACAEAQNHPVVVSLLPPRCSFTSILLHHGINLWMIVNKGGRDGTTEYVA